MIALGAPDPGPLGGAAFTGPVVTKTLLLIGMNDRQAGGSQVLVAFAKATGEQLATVALPESVAGTPMTYEVDGRQFVAAAFGGGSTAGLLALALP